MKDDPKKAAARARLMVGVMPPAGIIHGSAACVAGANKYRAYNWRETKLDMMVYCHAIYRHLLAFIDGEDYSTDDHCHHLGHIIATCSIALDSIENGGVNDDRPLPGKAAAMMARYRENGTLEPVDTVEVRDAIKMIYERGEWRAKGEAPPKPRRKRKSHAKTKV